MDWLERNLEAYRLVAQVLTELRTALRAGLERVHGTEWFRTGLPAGLLERLIEAKEQEKAIDWYESKYQEVMDYAVFPDLLEVLEHNGEHFPQLVRLAPSPALLHARFLELEVIRAKLGRTRPVSEGELSFLGTFQRRFEDALGGSPTTASEPSQRPARSSAAASEPPPAAAAAEPAEAADAVAPPSPPDPAGEASEAVEGPPRREATRPPQRPAQAAATTPPAPPPATDEPAQEAPTEPQRPTLSQALESNDSRNVLRELYREVTSIADGIWSSGASPSTPMWDAVSTSSWYEVNFSKLGLRPLSDFYEVVSQVTTRIDDGVGRNELQKFLKDINFAKVLLALRDMFQKAGI